MPFVLVPVKGGYKVGLKSGGKMSNGRYYLSNKVLSKKAAQAQKKAVEIRERKSKMK